MEVAEALERGSSVVGSVVELEGPVFTRQDRLWVVEQGSPVDLSSQSRGIVIKQPGLAWEMRAYMAVGGPVGVFRHVLVRGTLAESLLAPFPLMICDLEAVSVLDQAGRHEIALERIDELSQDELEAVDQASYSQEYKRQLLEKYRRCRKAW